MAMYGSLSLLNGFYGLFGVKMKVTCEPTWVHRFQASEGMRPLEHEMDETSRKKMKWMKSCQRQKAVRRV